MNKFLCGLRLFVSNYANCVLVELYVINIYLPVLDQFVLSWGLFVTDISLTLDTKQ